MLLSLLSKRSLEVDSRDSYGFALRPQHRQRYKEYANIYKEEEGERTSRWRLFLEQIPVSSKSCNSEKEENGTLSAESKSSLLTCSENEGENTLEIEHESDQLCHSEKEDQKTLESEDISDRSCYFQNEEKPSLEAEEKFNQPCCTQKEDKDVLVPQEYSSEPCHSENEDKACIQETVLEKHRGEGNDSGSKESVSYDSKQSNDEKDKHCSQEKRTCKVQKWVDIRPSLGAIENVLISRGRKRKGIEHESLGFSNDNLPSVAEEGATKEDIKVENCIEDTSDDCTNIPWDQNIFDVLLDPSSPWKELESLVQGGIPKELRGEVWQAFVGVSTRRVENYYEDLLAQVTNKDDSEDVDFSSSVPWKWRQQIEKDIPRTFPGHPALNEAGRNSLRRLLLAYARHNTTVGYCQGMNFFAGLLLLLMPEENAFWTLVGIMDDFFEGYYTEKMIESQLDQLVFEELMRERFPRLVNHLDYLGVQVAWISGPWFLSIFINMLPWESVLRVWDVMLFEGNRVMLFRTALALMELYGPSLATTEDAGDAITLLQSLAGSTFDSSQLVLNACMGFLAVNEAVLQELREKHRPSVLFVVEERARKGHVRKDSKGLASKLYTIKHERGSKIEERKASGEEEEKSQSESYSSKLDDLLRDVMVDSEGDSPLSLEDQVELCRLLEEKRAASLRAEELETALMEMVKEDNRRELSARVEQLEQEVALLQQALADKREQESAMLQVLMKVEQEQKITEEARRNAEHDASAQKYAVHVLEGKYEKAMTSIAEMEKRVKVAESMLEATLQYESGQSKASVFSSFLTSSGKADNSSKRLSLSALGLNWRDRNKGKVEESVESKSSPVSPHHNSSNKEENR